MPPFVIDFSHPQTVFLCSVLIATLQFVAVATAIFSMQKRYRGLESQKKRYSRFHKLFIRLEASLSQLQVLEKIHLINVHQTLEQEIEDQLNTLWIEIEKSLGLIASVEYVGKVKFSVLSVRAGFDLYKQMQKDFVNQSKLGEKAFAQYLLNSPGKELRISVEAVLKSGREASFKHQFAGYKINGALDFAWMVYPLTGILIFLSYFVVRMYASP